MSETQQQSSGSEKINKGENTLIGHLTELRDRLLKSVLTIIAIFASMAYFSNDLYEILSKPLLKHYPEGSQMIATSVASPFFAPFKLTMVLSVFIAMPMILNQIWGFIAPGLYRHEQKLVAPLLFSSIFLFYGGIAFAYFVLFPLALPFFISAAPEGVTVMTDINEYLDFTLTIFFAFGFAFQIPIATVLMIWSGMTTVENLRAKRSYVILGVFVIGMFLTPPDVISQTVLAVPMWLLYEAGMIFAILVKPGKRENSSDDEESSE